MGCYLALDNTLPIESVVASIVQCSWNTEILLTRNINADLSGIEGSEREEYIMAALEVAGLEDMSEHFLPR